MKKHLLFLIFLGMVSSCKKTEEIVTPANIFEDLAPKAYIDKFKSLSNAQMIDVRTLSEFNEGHRKEAILIDVTLADFDTQTAKLLNKNKAVFVYCRSGSRSKAAAQRLKDTGFTIIYNLNGGFVDIKDL
jgi:rhodanese-related sulfurtransferase